MIMERSQIGKCPEFMGIFGLSIHEKIADQILATTPTPGMDRDAWIAWSKTILPTYHNAIKYEGHPAFEVEDPETFLVYKAVAEKTGVKPGYVYLYLEALEALARAGDVKIASWQPAVAPEPGPIAKLLTPEPLPPESERKSVFWPIVLVGGIGLYLLRRMKRARAAA